MRLDSLNQIDDQTLNALVQLLNQGSGNGGYMKATGTADDGSPINTTAIFAPNGYVTANGVTSTAQKKKPMRLVGFGGNQVTDLGEDNTGAQPLDYSRGMAEIPGVGKGYYTRDGRYAIVDDGQGNKTKVMLGYDDAASQQRTNQALAQDAKRADIAQTQAQTANLQQGHWQVTPDGEHMFNPNTGEMKPIMVAANGQASGQGAQVPFSVGREQQNRRNMAYQGAMKDVQEAQKEAAGANDLEAALNRFEQLNRDTMTGRLSGAGPMAWARGAMSKDFQEMQSIQSQLAMNNFKPGQGAMSNFERSLIVGGGPNVANDEDANKARIQIMRGGVQNLKEKAFFKEALLNSGAPNLLGADQAWQEYLDKNPRYVQTNDGKLVENTNRQDWKQYFFGGRQQAQARNIPQAAISYLKANPNMRTAFDMKYGQGAAAQVLGQ